VLFSISSRLRFGPAGCCGIGIFLVVLNCLAFCFKEMSFRE
jgi:hypothetical protein